MYIVKGLINMKVLLKSLKELEEEFGIIDCGDKLIIDGCYIFDEMIDLLGKIVEAKYIEEFDEYFIEHRYYNSLFIKGEIIDEETK